jgi:hypothetical protein
MANDIVAYDDFIFEQLWFVVPASEAANFMSAYAPFARCIPEDLDIGPPACIAAFTDRDFALRFIECNLQQADGFEPFTYPNAEELYVALHGWESLGETYLVIDPEAYSARTFSIQTVIKGVEKAISK